MRPVGGRTQAGVGDVEDTFEAGEHDAAGHQRDERREQRQTGADGAAVGVVDAAPQVGNGEDKSRDDEEQTQRQVREKHRQRETGLVGPARE